MKTIKFYTEEESRFLRFLESAEALKGNSAKNGSQHSFRPPNPNKSGSKTAISINGAHKTKNNHSAFLIRKISSCQNGFCRIAAACSIGNLTAHEDATNDNHSHITLANGTVVSACWHEFPLPDDYQPWERLSNIPDSANWQIVGGNEV